MTPAPPRTAPTRSRWVVATVMLAMTLGSLPIFLLGAFSPEIQEALGLSDARFGAVFAAYFVAAMLLSFPAGNLSEWRGPGWTMSVAAVGVAVSLVGVGLSRTGFHLAMAVLLGGIANTLTQPAGNLALARALPPRRLGLAFALKQSSIPIASMIGGLAVPTLGLLLGWRLTIALGALPAIGVLIMARVTVPQRGRAPRRATGRGSTPLRPLLLLTIAGICGAAGSTGMIAFFVDSARTGGVGPAAAGIWFACAGVAAIAGRLLGAWLADGWKRRPPLTLCLAAFFGLGAVGYFMLAFADTWPLRVACTFPAFVAGWGWQGMFHHATVTFSPNAPARATGITQTGLSIGAFVGPITFGAVVDASSFRTAWIVVAALMAAAGTILAFSPRTGRPMSPDASSKVVTIP